MNVSVYTTGLTEGCIFGQDKFPSVNSHNSSKNVFETYHVQSTVLSVLYILLLLPQLYEEITLTAR